jgi:hypothetical protein
VRASIRTLMALAGVPFAASCEEPPRPTFPAVVHVESDPDVPVPGATLMRDGVSAGTTDEEGRTPLQFVGNEGEVVEVKVQCPEEFESPGPVTIPLRRVIDGKVPEYSVICAPRYRKVVVAVRHVAGSVIGNDLPLVYLGRPIARTDSYGVAHALVVAKPGETLDFTLDTAARPRLRPQNPATQYVVKSIDDQFVFEPKFIEDKLPPPPPKAKPPLPKLIGGGR